MIKKCVLALVCALLFGCGLKPKSLNNTAWYAFVKNDSVRFKAEEVYDFRDGMIRMYGDKVGYLMSKKSYEDFELSLEFRWNLEEKHKRDSGKKNSGVMYGIPEYMKDKIWPKGIQFQMKENSTGDFIFMDQVTAVVQGKMIAAGASVNSFKMIENELPYGEWNTIVIVFKEGKITHYLNGKLVNEAEKASISKGRISLNYEGSPIDFRNISIKKQ